VENGVNRVLIRSTSESGKIALSATAEGLKAASVSFDSRPVSVTGGLSLELPDSGLSPLLVRGPTPAGSSFTMSRQSVKIASAAAGANEASASFSFDDNETTEWKNDGALPTAWIRYDFDRPSNVNEVTLKLSGWRTQSYPVRISVDDHVVFEGNTPRSLGYVSFKFNPTFGKSLKIELTGAVNNRDAFGNIVEIPGTPDLQSKAGKGGDKGSLSIVEVEIYAPVKGDHSK
jgi:hypothetical protein